MISFAREGVSFADKYHVEHDRRLESWIYIDISTPKIEAGSG